jgi:transcriptional regulator with XRE-family HTH domain
MSTYTTAAEIRTARLTRGWSVAEAAREMKRRADRPVADIASLERSWKRWEAGVTPNHGSRELLRNLFDGDGRGHPLSRPPDRPSPPTVWRRWLAFELRRLREEAGLSQQQAAQECRWSAGRIGYIENAQQPLIEDDLQKLLTLYRVPPERWGAYLSAAAEQQRGWWQRQGDGTVPPWLSLFVGLERGASVMRSYEAVVIPGLLQTREYAAATVRADFVPHTDGQVDELTTVRIARQGVLARRERPLRLWSVIDEAALYRVAGGPEVMAAQLDHVVAMGRRPNVTIQVLPYAAGVNPYAFGPFRLLDFPWPTDPGVVYVEHRDGAIFLEEPHEVTAHALVFQHLASLALPPEASAGVLRERAAILTR